MSVTRGTEIATIDCVLVTVSPYSREGYELGLDTANKINVTIATETKEKITLIVKERLIAQKPPKTIVTGNTIVLTDNVFIPELVKILQGGTIKYDETDPTKVIGYASPVSGSEDTGEMFMLNVYSAIYDEASILEGYEKISYPNCQGVPIAFSTEDGVFRAIEYTINSAPSQGESAYVIDYVSELPKVEGITRERAS